VGDYGKYLTDSKKNAILIMPESRGKNLDHQTLNDPQEISAFFQAVDKTLGNAGVQSTPETARALSGHSGAYVQLGQWGSLASQESVRYLTSVQSMGLFDSVYGYRKGLADWGTVMRKNHEDFTYFSAYNPAQDAGKNAANQALQSQLCPQGPDKCPNIRFIGNSKMDHMKFMQGYMTEFFKRGLP
jgi:hypothetical protein